MCGVTQNLGRKVARRHSATRVNELSHAHIRHQTIALGLDRGFLLLRTVVRTAGVLLTAEAGHQMIEKLANGKVNWTTLGVAFLKGDVKNGLFLASIAILGVLLFRERHLRKQITEKHGELFKKYEESVDPSRTGSGLVQAVRAKGKHDDS